MHCAQTRARKILQNKIPSGAAAHSVQYNQRTPEKTGTVFGGRGGGVSWLVGGQEHGHALERGREKLTGSIFLIALSISLGSNPL